MSPRFCRRLHFAAAIMIALVAVAAMLAGVAQGWVVVLASLGIAGNVLGYVSAVRLGMVRLAVGRRTR